MNISFTFKNFEPSDHLRKYARRRFEKLNRFLSKAGKVEVSVLLAVDKFRHSADVKLTGDNLNISAMEQSGDMYGTIDLVYDKVLSQVKKYSASMHENRRIRAEGRSMKQTDVFSYTMSGEGTARIILGEDKFEPKPLHEDEAASQLEYRDEDDFLVFLNAETQLVNVLYRRRNGDFGLIELGGL